MTFKSNMIALGYVGLFMLAIICVVIATHAIFFSCIINILISIVGVFSFIGFIAIITNDELFRYIENEDD